MKRASDDKPTLALPRPNRRSAASIALAIAGCGALLLGACGGGDDDADDSSSTTSPAATTSTVASPTTTRATTTTTTLPALELVTEGATVVVANASRINGAAGRMTDQLELVGFTTGDATNSTEGQLETTRIYYDPANEKAKAVADSVREAMGAGNIAVVILAVPAPTDTGQIGDATVLVAMGNDTADKTLDELQGRAPVVVEDPGEEESSEEESSEEESSEEESSEEESSEEESSDESSEDG